MGTSKPYLFKRRLQHVLMDRHGEKGYQMNRFTDLRDKVLPMLRPYVKRIAVFGSFARGEETSESDIDILVELKDPEKRPRLGLGWFGLEDELSRILGREVELIAEGSLSPYLRPYAEKDLVLLYPTFRINTPIHNIFCSPARVALGPSPESRSALSAGESHVGPRLLLLMLLS